MRKLALFFLIASYSASAQTLTKPEKIVIAKNTRTEHYVATAQSTQSADSES